MNIRQSIISMINNTLDEQTELISGAKYKGVPISRVIYWLSTGRLENDYLIEQSIKSILASPKSPINALSLSMNIFPGLFD